jgi:hypothetical protein
VNDKRVCIRTMDALHTDVMYTRRQHECILLLEQFRFSLSGLLLSHTDGLLSNRFSRHVISEFFTAFELTRTA